MEQRPVGKPYDILISIASDYYSATLSIDLHDEMYKLTREKLIEELKLKNVIFGLDYDVLDTIAQNPAMGRGVVVARGIVHENGTDGYITYTVDLSKDVKPKILENGTVDFKDLTFIHTVKAGDELATKTDPTPGRTGTTVTNKLIQGKQGKPVNFKFGKNVTVSDDGMHLSATCDGSIQFDGERISVIEYLEIKGDVGVKTGNIRFAGKVTVTGNVTTGYRVDCDDDLEIRGVVESAEIRCSKNVTIGMGIQGNDAALLEIGGNLVCNFMNSCKAIVKGNIETNSIMHCNVVCDGAVHVKGKQGLIVGGELDVKREIVAKTIGSEIGTITELRLGLDSKIIEQYKQLTDAIKVCKENMQKVDQLQNLLKRQKDSDPSNQSYIDMYDKSLISHDQYKAEFALLSKQFIDMNTFMNELQDSKVTASLLYVGTRIRIGNTHYHVKNDLKNVVIHKDGGNIVASSF